MWMRQNTVERNHKTFIAFREKNCALERQKVLMRNNAVRWAQCDVRDI